MEGSGNGGGEFAAHKKKGPTPRHEAENACYLARNALPNIFARMHLVMSLGPNKNYPTVFNIRFH